MLVPADFSVQPLPTVAAVRLCQGCGASMSYDASVKALRCPFCGSAQLKEQADQKEIAPSAVVPFTVLRDQADELLREWLGKGFWRPGDLAR